MHKKVKRQIGLYYALREWFDPAIEGSPYGFEEEVKKAIFKQEVKPLHRKVWITA